MWTIQDATQVDHTRIIEMSFGIQQAEHELIGYPMLPVEQTTDRYVKAIIETASTKNGEILVAKLDDKAVAYLIGYPKIDEDDLVETSFHTHAHIADLFVEPEARKLGIASALMQEFESRMGAKGYNWLRIGVQAKNHIAISAYEKQGFEPLSMYMVKKL